MSESIAERVLTAARLMLIRHGEQFPVDPLALEWARFIVSSHRPPALEEKPGQPRDSRGRFYGGPRGIVKLALDSRFALELAWMP